MLGTDYGKAGLEFLAARRPVCGAAAGTGTPDPVPPVRFRGQYGQAPAEALVAAAKETLALWGHDGVDGMDFAELAADIAVEAEQALFLNAQIKDVEERIANLYAEADPDGIVASAPGVGAVIGAVIAGRLGDPHRFTSLAAVRAYSGLVPKVNQSRVGETKPGSPRPATRCCARCCSWPPTRPAWSTRSSPRSPQRLMSGDRHRDSAVSTSRPTS